MNKINGIAKMNRSAENPTTAHTLVRCVAYEDKKTSAINDEIIVAVENINLSL